MGAFKLFEFLEKVGVQVGLKHLGKGPKPKGVDYDEKRVRMMALLMGFQLRARLLSLG